MEDRLPCSRTGVDDDTVIGQAASRSDVGDEVEHPLRLVGRELRDLAEALDVPLGDDEQMRLRLRVDVLQGDEPVGGRDVVALGVQLAEEAVVRQRESPPP
jgi:hypothetical protein